MIIWRIHRLTDQLRSGHFSAQQMRPYLVAAMLWASAAFIFADWSRPWDRDEFEAGVDSLSTLINGVISAFGVHWCYRANGGGSGAQLAARLWALGVVLFVRFLVGGMIALIGWVLAIEYLNPPLRPAFEELDLLSVVLTALFWVRLRHHIATVAVSH
jgi:hypothetical protein